MRKNNKAKITTATILAELMHRCCPICGGSLIKGISVLSHAYALLASVVVNDQQARTQELLELVAHHQWSEAIKFREWDSLKDNIEVYVVRCVSKDQLVVLVLDDPFELFLDTNLITYDVLDQETSKSLQAAIAEWQLFS